MPDDKNLWEDAETDEVSKDNPLLREGGSTPDTPSTGSSSLEEIPGLAMDYLEHLGSFNSWVDHFNNDANKHKGKEKHYFASMPEIYSVLRDIAINRSESERNNLVKNFQRKAEGRLILTSTRVDYQVGSNILCKINHNYGSDRAERFVISFSSDAFNNGIVKPRLEGALGNPTGLEYFRALFMTDDNAETIDRVIRTFFGVVELGLKEIRDSNTVDVLGLVYSPLSGGVPRGKILECQLDTAGGALDAHYRDSQGGSR